MTKDQLIAKQQLEIEMLKEESKRHAEACDEVHRIIYCIGGPLNDNKLGYTREQMRDFWAIKEALGLAT
jgi:hypothetical protein